MTDAQLNSLRPARQGKAWTFEEDHQLYDGFLAGRPTDAIASEHQRSEGGILARLRRLGLIDQDGMVIEPPPPFAVPRRRRSGTTTNLVTSGDDHGMYLILAATTADGWRIEIKSNRTLNESMVERLTLMLRGGIGDFESGVPF